MGLSMSDRNITVPNALLSTFVIAGVCVGVPGLDAAIGSAGGALASGIFHEAAIFAGYRDNQQQTAHLRVFETMSAIGALAGFAHGIKDLTDISAFSAVRNIPKMWGTLFKSGGPSA